jgi:hypothetical protein
LKLTANKTATRHVQPIPRKFAVEFGQPIQTHFAASSFQFDCCTLIQAAFQRHLETSTRQRAATAERGLAVMGLESGSRWRMSALDTQLAAATINNKNTIVKRPVKRFAFLSNQTDKEQI